MSGQADNREFSPKTKLELGKLAHFQCSNPDCLRSTSLPDTKRSKTTSVGEAAHINANKARFARYNPDLTREEIVSINNGIWLCNFCHKMIDDDEVKYSVTLLKKWKFKAETQSTSIRDLMQEVANIAIANSKDGDKLSLNRTAKQQLVTKKIPTDENIRKSFERWNAGEIGEAIRFSESAYYYGEGGVKLQAIINMILLSKDDLDKVGYYIALCDEGIHIAEQLKYLSASGTLKAHKARLVNQRVFENMTKAYSEKKMSELTGFSSLNQGELSGLMSLIKTDAELVHRLASESQQDAIQSGDYSAVAQVQMTLASTMGQSWFVTKLVGGPEGEIEHFVIQAYLEAKRMYEKIGDMEGVAYALHNLANNLRFFNKLDRAMQFSLESLQVAGKLENKELIKKIRELQERLRSPNGTPE